MGAVLDGEIQDPDERCEARYPEVVLPKLLDLQAAPRYQALRSRRNAALGKRAALQVGTGLGPQDPCTNAANRVTLAKTQTRRLSARLTARSRERPVTCHTRGMVASDEDAAAVRFPPPLVYMFAVMAGIGLHEFAVRFALGFGLAARVGAGVVSGTAGLALLAAAAGRFKRSGQDPKPWKVTPEIISTGIYGITRNPMYVAMGLLQLGVGVALDNGWILVLLPAVLGIVYVTAIRHEESYLQAKFGESYERYRGSVRRWI